MDKLREILVYRFWGLLVVALIVPLIGWWIGSGAATSAIAARKSEINAAYSAIPKGDFVNDKWIKGVEEINTKQQELIDQAWQRLAEGQINLKTWPPEIADEIAKYGPADEFPTEIRNIYHRNSYKREWAEVWLLANPIRFGKMDPQTGLAPTVGIVEFEIRTLPILEWGTDTPTTQEVRDAQEDIWLFRSLVEAIANVNNGVENRADAVVTRIESIQLLDDLFPKPALNTFSEPVNIAPPEGGFTEVAGGAGGGGGGRKGNKKDRLGFGGDDKDDGGPSTGLEGIDEFFPARSAEPIDFFDTQEASAGGGFDEDNFTMPGELNTPEATVKEARRYVEDTSQYKTRAFDMIVEMDHVRLPDLLASLSDSPWPVKILRVEQKLVTSGGRSVSSRNERKADDFNDTDATKTKVIVADINGRPHQAIVQITGTMRIFKSLNEITPDADSSGGFEQPVAEAAGSKMQSHTAAGPSFRSTELNDPELFQNITDKMDGKSFSPFGGGAGRGGTPFGGMRRPR